MDHRLAEPAYEPAEAARLLRLHPARVKRWLRGYGYAYQQQIRRAKPVVVRDVDSRYASFLDLMEMYFVRAFLEHGISLHKMRKALAEAEQLFRMDHPFARQKFFTDGREIFTEIEAQAKNGRRNLLQLLSGGQWAIADIVLQYAKQIDFARAGEAERWWPLGRATPVVVDPRVAFGAPSVAGHGVKTSVVFDLFEADGRKQHLVAQRLSIEPSHVSAAVLFEQKLQMQPA